MEKKLEDTGLGRALHMDVFKNAITEANLIQTNAIQDVENQHKDGKEKKLSAIFIFKIKLDSSLSFLPLTFLFLPKYDLDQAALKKKNSSMTSYHKS